MGGNNYLGQTYFLGEGVPQDYAKAFQYLSEMNWENREANYMRGVIFARGLGGMAEDIPQGRGLPPEGREP